MAGGRFSLEITDYVKRQQIKLQDVVRGIAFGLAGNIVTNTPVDTGQARGNWKVTMDTIDKEKTGIKDKVGERTLNRIAHELEAYTPSVKHIYLSNTLQYIVMLEYGWSKQSPAGMVRLALLNTTNIRVHSLF